MSRIPLCALLLVLGGCASLLPVSGSKVPSPAPSGLTTVAGTGIVTGNLVDAKGQPVAQAPIDVFAAASGSATTTSPVATGSTDASGDFEVPDVPAGTVSVEAEPTDGQRALKLGVVVSAGQTANAGTLTLQPTGAISGQVAFALAPAGGALGTDVFIPGTSFDAKTDASGDYTIVYVPAGDYGLVASRAGYLPASTDSVVVAPGNTTTAPTLTLGIDGGAVSGKATLFGQTSSAGITVTLTLASSNPSFAPGATLTATTAADGTFSVDHVPAGTYTVTFSDPPFVSQSQSNVTVTESSAVTTTPVTLQISQTVLSSTVDNIPVVSPDGTTLAYAQNGTLYIQPIGGQPQALWSDTVNHYGPVGYITWSPDGQKLAFFDTSDTYVRTLYAINLADPEAILTLGQGTDFHPFNVAWDPTSSEVAFNTGASTLDTATLTGATQSYALEPDYLIGNIAWSPQNNQIAVIDTNQNYNSSDANDNYLDMVSTTTGATSSIAALGTGTVNALFWKPDAGGLYFSQTNNGNLEAIADSAGATATAVVSNLGSDVVLSPDGARTASVVVNNGISTLVLTNLSSQATASVATACAPGGLTACPADALPSSSLSLGAQCWFAGGKQLLFTTYPSFNEGQGLVGSAYSVGLAQGIDLP